MGDAYLAAGKEQARLAFQNAAGRPARRTGPVQAALKPPSTPRRARQPRPKR